MFFASLQAGSPGACGGRAPRARGRMHSLFCVLRTNRRAAPARQHGCAAAAPSHMPIKMACEKQTEVDEYRIGRGRWTSIHYGEQTEVIGMVCGTTKHKLCAPPKLYHSGHGAAKEVSGLVHRILSFRAPCSALGQMPRLPTFSRGGSLRAMQNGK